MLRRRSVLLAVAAAGLTPVRADPVQSLPLASAAARLKRLKMATIAGDDLGKIERWYAGALNYRVIERGVVGAALALSWGAPAMAGRRLIVMQPEDGGDVFVRAVEIDAIARAKPLTTWGWSAIEITVRDLDALYDKLKRGWLEAPIAVLGKPQALAANSPIFAMQVLGPAGEVLYLTSHTGDRTKSNHPEAPRGLVGRPFIAVLAGPDLAALKSFYTDGFDLGDQGDLSLPVASRAAAHGLPAGHVYTISVLVCAERGNKMELDGFPSGTAPQPRHDGQLPPGTAMMSFSVAGFGEIGTRTFQAPTALYGATPAASFVGPAGEYVELIADRL